VRILCACNYIGNACRFLFRCTGARKLISTQKECIGDAAKDVAVQVPDIGHFIKYISNGLYKLADRSKSLKGKCLLKPLRIHCIAGDIKRHLKSFHNFFSDIKKKVWTTAKEQEDGKLDDATATCRSTKLLIELDTTRERCLLRVESIILHHAGDHSLCCIGDCV
jgi:hypothetical protein